MTAAFPGIRAGVVVALGLDNGPSSPALLRAYRRAQEVPSQRLKVTPIAELPSIAAWRAFGVKPTQHWSAIEALLRRLDKHGDIPSINMLVDLGNLVSIRHLMPAAVFDCDNTTGNLTVRFADGSETFTDIASGETAHPVPGEVIFADDENRVSARRWCWRQSAYSATSSDTATALFVVEATTRLHNMTSRKQSTT